MIKASARARAKAQAQAETNAASKCLNLLQVTQVASILQAE